MFNVYADSKDLYEALQRISPSKSSQSKHVFITKDGKEPAVKFWCRDRNMWRTEQIRVTNIEDLDDVDRICIPDHAARTLTEWCCRVEDAFSEVKMESSGDGIILYSDWEDSKEHWGRRIIAAEVETQPRHTPPYVPPCNQRKRDRLTKGDSRQLLRFAQFVRINDVEKIQLIDQPDGMIFRAEMFGRDIVMDVTVAKDCDSEVSLEGNKITVPSTMLDPLLDEPLGIVELSTWDCCSPNFGISVEDATSGAYSLSFCTYEYQQYFPF